MRRRVAPYPGRVTTLAEQATEEPRVPDGRRAALTRLARLVLGLASIVLMAAVVVVGERESSLRDLEEAVASGGVREVRLSEGLGPGERGYASVWATWRTGLVTRGAWVVEARPLRADRADADGPPADGRVRGDLRSHLSALDPDVRFEPTQNAEPRATVAGWGVPGPLAAANLVLYLLTLCGALLGRTRPWRATRAAWTWVVLLLPPIGVPAYLFLAGPTTGVRPPRTDRMWLTGGWAFLLALVVSAVVPGT